MKKYILVFSIIGSLCGLNSCQHTSRSAQKGTTQFTNPSKYHPYPVRSKNRANQKH